MEPDSSLADRNSFLKSLFTDQQLSSTSPAVSQKNPLLLILLDSFRWDLLDQFSQRTNRTLPGFARLINSGGYIKRVLPVFPAECHPNIISLLTGLYPAEHGVLFTKMYDEPHNRSIGFMEFDADSITEDVKRKMADHGQVHLYHIPFCSSLISESTSCEAYSPNHMTPLQLENTVGRAIERLRDGRSDVAVVYYDKLDHLGHKYGPLSDQLISHLLELDFVIDRLVDQVTADGEFHPHLIVTSDHGMTEVSGSTESLDRLISGHQVKKIINRGSTVSIWPHPEEHEKILFRLSSPRIKNFTLYTNETIPAEWHSGGVRFPPILLVAKTGSIFNSKFWPIELSHDNLVNLKGVHGYDTAHLDMHVPLFLLGPGIKPGAVYVGHPKDQVSSHGLLTALSAFTDVRSHVSPPARSFNSSSLRFIDPMFSIFRNSLFIMTLSVTLCFVCLVAGLLAVLFRHLKLPSHHPPAEMEEKLLQSQENFA